MYKPSDNRGVGWRVSIKSNDRAVINRGGGGGDVARFEICLVKRGVEYRTVLQ